MSPSTGRVKSTTRSKVSFKTSTSSFAHRPKQPPLSLAALDERAAFLLAHSHAPRTQYKYRLALKKWTVFTATYNLDFVPSSPNLVRFVAYLSIGERWVATVLSGLAFYFKERMDNWDAVRSHPSVSNASRATRLLPHAETKRAPPLRPDHLSSLFRLAFADDSTYDNLLVLAIAVAGFGGLMRLGELVGEPVTEFFDARKVVKRNSVIVEPGESFSFVLPFHKGDKFFEGSTVGLVKEGSVDEFNFVRVMHTFVIERDKRVPLSATFLFVKEDGSQPSRRWFLKRLAEVDPLLTGHSLRAGGATFLANRGIANELIMQLGRWSSSAFRIYLRDHASVALAANRHQLA